MGRPAAVRRDTGRRCALTRLEDNWDNDDVRIRPSKRSRPRSKIRPRHNDAIRALVTTVDRGRYTCLVGADGADPGAASRKAAKRAERRGERVVTAMRARELGRRAIAVGDRVDLVGDTAGGPDALARIVRIADRTSELRRSTDDTEGSDATEKVLVANADQLVIVTAVADPLPRTGFIDRCLVAAYAGNLQPVLLLTKADLADPAELLAAYAELDLPVLVSSRETADRSTTGALVAGGVDEVRDLLRGRMSVLVGHSGVGKSTLVNALVPDAYRAIGSVTGVGKGRHTSTSAIALRLPAGGWVIDTPGVRSFGLAHVTADDLLVAFDDLVEATADCPPGCDHLQPGCALDTFVAAGGATQGRLDSFRRLLRSRAGQDDRDGGTGTSEVAEPPDADHPDRHTKPHR